MSSVVSPVPVSTPAPARRRHKRPSPFRADRGRFVALVEQQLDALPGPEDLDLVGVNVVASPDESNEATAAMIAVEATFSLDCRKWVLAEYERNLRQIAVELLRIADAARDRMGGPAHAR